MRAHYFQHVPFEGLGSIKSWLDKTGFEIKSTRFFESADLPNPDEIDFLLIMGGPMSVNDEEEYPWLINEKTFIREFIKTGKPVLGVCLGAQLIASSLGAKVYPNSEKEIGWFPVTTVSPEASQLFSFPSSTEVFHWHGETFDLPGGANLLARSIACKNQAFQVDQSVIGLQFHVEMTPESIQALVSNCRNELKPSTYIQTEEELLSAKPEQFQAAHQLMDKVLSFLHQQ